MRSSKVWKNAAKTKKNPTRPVPRLKTTATTSTATSLPSPKAKAIATVNVAVPVDPAVVAVPVDPVADALQDPAVRARAAATVLPAHRAALAADGDSEKLKVNGEQ